MNRLILTSICTILIFCIFTACSSASPAPSASVALSDASSSAEYYPETEAFSAGNGAYSDGGDYKYGEHENESAIPLPILTPSGSNGKKMIYTVSLDLQTTDFRAGMRKLLDTVSEMEGYVESANVNGRDLRYPETERNAGYTFRVPSERLAELLVIFEENYNLWSLRQESQDSTVKYEQTDSRLSNLIAQEKRLIEDLEKASGTAERLSLERKLTEVQASISALNASQSAIQDSTIYSTVHVQLYEVSLRQSEPELLFGERLSKTVSGSINGFVSFCQSLLLAVITLAPIALILSILAVAALPLIRFIKKRLLSAKAENVKVETIIEKSEVVNRE